MRPVQNFTPDAGGLRDRNRQRIEALRDRFLGRQCVVLCTGPSVAEVDLPSIDRHPYVMGVNGSFALRNHFHSYFVDSPAFIGKNLDRIARIEAEHFFVREQAATACLRAGIKEDQLVLHNVPDHQIADQISVDLTAGLPFGPTVLLTIVLPAVVWCGFQEVLLLGADYPRKGYSRFAMGGAEGVPRYPIKAAERYEREMEIARLRALLWADFLRSRTPRVRVINCSSASELEAFERAPLASVIRD
jgi:hypothetical protein